ncbi:MAG: restriction endonuclease subunit S, partial [Clostridia bacterium]|nr:restriction endonuclease subunit S [Clostridia bacterium]
AILRPHNIAPAYLAAYLSSPIGQSLAKRWKRGAVQTGLLLEDMDQIPVARFSVVFEEAVINAVDRAYTALEISRGLLQQAEQTLLHALGLDTWTPPKALSYERSSREAFAARRLDAEHFHPKFQALMNSLYMAGNCVRLGDYLLVNQRGKQPDYADEGLPVINSKHVLRNEVRIDEDNRQAVVAENVLQIQTNDVLINGTGVGTIGRAAAYLHDDPALPDNHVTILRPSDILDPVYLSVYLNSAAGQLQVEQRLRGSSGQIELYPADIAEFRIWLAPQAVQQSIRQQVEQSFEQRKQATRLLDAAKRAVEIAIEDSEAAALTYFDGW